ncbi:MAG: hypothetical protein M3520_12955, partial [Actinomycetota bacterium]|nr:hypothetical protein [Actinomycetota bacterium]
MADESDGVDEAVEGVLRVGLTAAGPRMAEIIARAREQAAREAQAASEHEARELAERLTAERSAARAQLAPVHRGDCGTRRSRPQSPPRGKRPGRGSSWTLTQPARRTAYATSSAPAT